LEGVAGQEFPAPRRRPGRRTCGGIRVTLESQQQRRAIMIVIDHQPNRVGVSVFGEFTLADYKEFEEVVNFKVQFEGPVDLYFDLSQMAGLTLDVAWEEVKFSRAHANDFKRVAVVTDSQWVTWSAWISQTFVNADVEVFDNADDAKAWLDE
jgi:hypothetical protein